MGRETLTGVMSYVLVRIQEAEVGGTASVAREYNNVVINIMNNEKGGVSQRLGASGLLIYLK